MYDLSGRAVDGPLAIGYVGGGSHGWAPTLMNDLAQSPLDATVRLYDIDHGAAEKNARFGNWVQGHEAARGTVEYTAEHELGAALEDVDVVVCSTQDPPAETYVHDLAVPREYGIHQTVGDTVGPGGALRAMRAVPQYREIAAAVREHCPDAWVLNYTNPMSVCTRTLYEEYPAINAVGLCHGVFGTQRLLAALVGKYRNADPDWRAIDVEVTGINHCTWLTGARYRGRPVDGLLDRELETEGLQWGVDVNREGVIVDDNRVLFDVYRRFGAFPAIGGRHLAEFVPRYLDIEDPGELERWGLGHNDADAWLADWEQRKADHEALLAGGEFSFEASGEVGVDIIEALRGRGAVRTNVNLPNRGQAPGLPGGAVVETNALVTGGAVTPLTAGRLPESVESLIGGHVSNQETLVAAGFDGDVDRAYRAFLSDPLVNCDPATARKLFVDLVDRQRDYLADWDLEGAAVLEGRP